jgi:hypothetical protein
MKSIEKIAVIFFLLITVVSAQSKEMQFNCTYESSVRINSGEMKGARSIVKNIKTDFIFFINDVPTESSYLNLAHKVKSPLQMVLANPSLITAVESINSDNHFSVTIFVKPNSLKQFPSVMYLHAWDPSLPDNYLPKMDVGTCKLIG